MDSREISTRTLQQAGKLKDTLLHRLGIEALPARLAGGVGRAERGRFFCDARDVPQIVAELRRRMPDRANQIVAESRRIVEHRFRLLGYEALNLGADIDWQRDAVHGKQAPLAPWPTIPFLNFGTVGDHKVTWELIRLQFLMTLAKANIVLPGTEQFARKLKGFLERTGGIRIPIRSASTGPARWRWRFRSLSCVWTAFLLEGTEADSEEFQADMTREIARAGWYIRRFLSTYFSPNTHLLGEAVALFVLGVRYPGLADAGEWRETGWKIVGEEAQNQVGEDGLHCEQSIYYHTYALDL